MIKETKKRILIVEDDEMLGSLLAAQFEGEGFTTLLAHEGVTALDKMLHDHPDAVILDISMPKKNGIEVLKEFHERMPHSELPIIVLTNSNNMDDIAQAMSNKAVAYLVKADQDLQTIVEKVKVSLL